MEEGIGSCNGGAYDLAHEFIYTYGITDTSCMPNIGVDESVWGELDIPERMCRNCDLEGTCEFINGTFYHLDGFGKVQGEPAMMEEIYERGTISCAIWGHADGFETYSGGVIVDPNVYPGITHIVSVVGWGQDFTNGTALDYWVVRNTIGTWWGENGFFRLERGSNTYNIESTDCWFGIPAQETVDAMLKWAV